MLSSKKSRRDILGKGPGIQSNKDVARSRVLSPKRTKTNVKTADATAELGNEDDEPRNLLDTKSNKNQRRPKGAPATSSDDDDDLQRSPVKKPTKKMKEIAFETAPGETLNSNVSSLLIFL